MTTNGSTTQKFSLLSQQNISGSLPNPNTEIEPVFSPNHDLLLIPSHSNQEKSVTMAHLQKPLFKENLNGPFSFRPDGLLINSGSEGIIIDQERRKWRGGVGTCTWIELDCRNDTDNQFKSNFISLDITSSSNANNQLRFRNLISSSLSDSLNRNDTGSSTNLRNSTQAVQCENIASPLLSKVITEISQPSSISSRSSTLNSISNVDQEKKLEYVEDAVSASSLLGPLYTLYNNADYLTMLSSQISKDKVNFNEIIYNHEIDTDMELLVSKEQNFLMILHNDNLITLKMFGRIKIGTLTIEKNDFYPQSKLIGLQDGNGVKISFIEYGDYGIVLNNIKLDFEQENAVSLASMDCVNRISRHLSYVQYILLDKLPKVLDYMESAWNSFFNGFKKNIIDTYDLGLKNTDDYNEDRFQEKSPFVASFIELLINGECLHWNFHKEWLTNHASEKNLLKLIRTLNATKTTIISYIVNFVEVYIKHAIYYLSTIRGYVRHQKLTHEKDILSESICSTMIDSLKDFYSKTTQFSIQFTKTHSNLLNLLSFLLLHQGKSLAVDQKYTPPEGISATFDNFQLTQFLFTLMHGGMQFEDIIFSQSTDNSALSQKLDPLQSYFSVEGGLKRIHQQLIVDLSSIIDNFSSFISKGMKVLQKNTIPIYEPTNIIGFTTNSHVYWAFFSLEKWVCLKVDQKDHISICVLTLDEKVVQFKYYKTDPSNGLIFIFLTESETQESFIKTASVSDSMFVPCQDTSEITAIVDSSTHTLQFSKTRQCPALVSQMTVGIRGLCAVFGKQQFWIYDLEGEDSDEEDEVDMDED